MSARKSALLVFRAELLLVARIAVFDLLLSEFAFDPVSFLSS
jgi:hypothetical protein